MNISEPYWRFIQYIYHVMPLLTKYDFTLEFFVMEHQFTKLNIVNNTNKT